jgi:hypothetical protein
MTRLRAAAAAAGTSPNAGPNVAGGEATSASAVAAGSEANAAPNVAGGAVTSASRPPAAPGTSPSATPAVAGGAVTSGSAAGTGPSAAPSIAGGAVTSGSAAAMSSTTAPRVADPGASAFSAVEPGFLPYSVEVAMAPSPDLLARTAELAARLRRLPGVTEVEAMTEGLARLEAWLALGERLGVVAVALAAVSALALTALVLVMGRRRRQREAEVLALLGETAIGTRLALALPGMGAALVGAVVGLGLATAIVPRALSALAAQLGVGVGL